MGTRALRRFVASGWAPWLLLVVAAVAHVVITVASAGPFRMVDLDVYVQGARHFTDGTLYDFTTVPLHLPFTYPPFSALIFTPLTWLPWTLTRVLWQLAMFGAVALIVYLTLRLLGRAGPGADRPLTHVRGVVVTGTALALWLEPVRTTFNYGQINLFLAALLLGGAVSTRQWWAGTTVGLAAGIKLVPAVAGIYYLLTRRYLSAVWAVIAFAATVLVVLAIIPGETWRYFTRLIFDPARTGQVWAAINQSWRGALARLAGHDVTTSWLLACAVSVIIGVWAAWAAVRAGDRTAAFLSVQFVGLLVSPISWSHHWVWVLPLLIWAVAGPHHQRLVVRLLAAAWMLACCSYLVSVLVAVQGDLHPASRPGWQAWLAAVYPVLGLATLVVVLVVSRAGVRSPAVVADSVVS